MNEFFHINMNESNSNANIQYHNKLFEIWETIKNKIPIKKNIDYKKFSKKLKSSIRGKSMFNIFKESKNKSLWKFSVIPGIEESTFNKVLERI